MICFYSSGALNDRSKNFLSKLLRCHFYFKEVGEVKITSWNLETRTEEHQFTDRVMMKKKVLKMTFNS